MVESAPMPTLLRTESFVLEHYLSAGFIRLARTAQPLPKPSQVVDTFDLCRAALAGCEPAKLGIMVDWRLVTLAPEAEGNVVDEVQKFGATFARRALLLLGAADDAAEQAWAGTSFQVYFDEDQALAHVSAL
jgi:hypothetical protein